MNDGVYCRASGRKGTDAGALWFLPGFADTGAAFAQLFKTALADRFHLHPFR